MKYTPAANRLRQVAKAYAVGEFSLTEYRQARRELIDNFISNLEEDDTQRRNHSGSNYASQVTSRPQTPAFQNHPPQSSGHLTSNVHEQDQKSGTKLLVLCLLSALLVFVAMNSMAQAKLDYIPAVSERDPNPATSPRYAIDQIRVQMRHDESTTPFEVKIDTVNTLATELLDSLKAQLEPAEHGFSILELEELGRYLNALGVHENNAALNDTIAEDIIALVQDQKERRGVRLHDLESVAAGVQQFYRDKGYFLAAAYIPSQNVESGTLAIEVLPGVLGAVEVSGGSADLASVEFTELLGNAVTRADIESRLFRVNALPGVQAQASFEPGSEIGETQLNIDVVQQKQWSGRVQLDNYGDEFTGEYRVAGNISWLNPLGYGDVLDASLIQTTDPANQTYGLVRYQLPVFDSDYDLRLSVSNNQFNYEGGSVLDGDIDGDSRLFGVGLSKTFSHSRSMRFSGAVDLEYHRLLWEDLPDQSISLVKASTNFRKVFDARRLVADAQLSLTAGRISDGAFDGQEEDFWRLATEMFVWKPLDMRWLPGEQKVALLAGGQLTSSRLPSTLRVGFGGPDIGRGFDRSVYRADRGAYMSLQVRTPLPLGELRVFADTSYGETMSDATRTWGHLTSFGLGWEAEYQRWRSQVSWALPLAAQGTDGIDNAGTRFYWSLQYAF